MDWRDLVVSIPNRPIEVSFVLPLEQATKPLKRRKTQLRKQHVQNKHVPPLSL